MSCNSKKQPGNDTLFSLLLASETGIDFENKITYTEEFNPYTFRNFFNGGGVAIGDVNNDGLADIFFCSNQQSNKLYLNKGNFKFEDITDKAGLNSTGVWSSGVSMADVNGDGWLDIYICKSGNMKGEKRYNELFINNHDLSFTERAHEFGLDTKGLSTNAAFFDMDNDGDLDCYLLNNSVRSVSNFYAIKNQRLVADTLGGNKLLRNDNGHFTDITKQAGIYASNIGFGLGVTVGDINNDGWQDIYVSNDFFEKDYLYINQKNGSFKECLEDCINAISMNSMGADIADINNDGWPEIYTSDMMPDDNERIKTKTNFENWDKYENDLQNGYYKQYVRNALQLNNGVDNKNDEVSFSEVSRYAGTYATDWSWGALITDLNNDGYKDIFVANGIYKDITDQDYIQYASDAYSDIKQQILDKKKNILLNLIKQIPSHKLSNYCFSNNGDVTFTNKAKEWGLAEPGFSNGSAYGDLDNDGDLDLVVNNVNMPCFVYENKTTQQHKDNKYISITLQGEGRNKFGVGAKVTVHYNNTIAYQEQMPQRGFESSVDTKLIFGLGQAKKIDSVTVDWPSGKESVIKNAALNSSIVVKEELSGIGNQVSAESFELRAASKEEEMNNEQRAMNNEQAASFKPQATSKEDTAVNSHQSSVNSQGSQLTAHSSQPSSVNSHSAPHTSNPISDTRYLFTSTSDHGLTFQHTENAFTDFDRDRLTFQMLSTQGPRIAKGDINKDGLDDIYICGASGQAGVLYQQTKDHTFKPTNQSLLQQDALCEDTDALFFDCDNDGDEDLYVCSGGNEFPSSSTALISRLYINDGKGIFIKSQQVLPSPILFESSSCVTAADYDKDGDMDLFVGVRLKPFSYGMPCKSYILNNDGKGHFTDVTTSVCKDLLTAGMITDAQWTDYDKDGKPDLVTAGEYNPVQLYHNEGNGTLKQITKQASLDSTNGWWNRLEIADINNDGYLDIVAANHGLNSRFKATKQQPVCMYVSDFDGNGTTEQVITCYNKDTAYPMALRHDLVNVLPYLKNKYLKYESYKNATIENIFTKEQLSKAVCNKAYDMMSCVFINNKHGGYDMKPLPMQAQLSQMYAISVNDYDKDGNEDILMHGNFYQSKPEAGIYDATYGILLKGDGKGNFTAMPEQQSGLHIRGAARDIAMVKAGKDELLVMTFNNDKVKVMMCR